MAGDHWTLDDIPWGRFDSDKVDGELLKIAKSASLVEYNAGDYAQYLCNVFPDDAHFQAAVIAWSDEEVQHGEALAKWAKLCDPDFDFDESFARFAEGYQIQVDSRSSIRGSRCGELVARCIVEVGTSSYYSALADACREPVLIEICRRIAADELRHYKMFYDHMKRYLEQEQVGRLRRLAIALGRIGETEDDELAYAYYAANAKPDEPYVRRVWSREYLSRAYGYYERRHFARAISMTMKAAGANPHGLLAQGITSLGFGYMRLRRFRPDAEAA